MQKHTGFLGIPCAGSTSDILSLKSCRESFAFGCLRGSFILDGDMVAEVSGHPEYKGQLVDFSPLLAFERFTETRHTGAALARFKVATFKQWKLEGAISLATEDGASNNKSADRIIRQDQMVCTPHDIARVVLIACGEAGKPCQNPTLTPPSRRSSGARASSRRPSTARPWQAKRCRQRSSRRTPTSESTRRSRRRRRM
eukprot:7388260-Prymnesium_polylepis.1